MSESLAPGPNAPPDDETLRWLAEAVCLLALTWVASRCFGVRLEGIEALAVAVAVIGGRYGLWAGTVAGLMAGGLMLGERQLPIAAWFALSGVRVPVYAATAQVVIGAAVGLVGEGHVRQRLSGREALADTAERLQRLQRRYEAALAAKETLEKRFVRQVQPLTSLYRAIRRLDSPREVLADEALRLALRFFEADAAAYYECVGDGLRLARALGEHADRPSQLGPGDHLLALAVASGKAVAARSRAEYADLPVLMAAPVPGPEGRVRGAIAIESLPFARLNPASTRMLELLAEWLGAALEKTALTGFCPIETFQAELQREWRLAERFKLPLGVLHVTRAGSTPDEGWWQALIGLAATPGALVGLADDGASGWVLLPATWPEAVQAIAGRIEHALGATVRLRVNDESLPAAELVMPAIARDEVARDEASGAPARGPN